MSARKSVKTISISGIGAGLGLVSASTDSGYGTEVDSIAAYGDEWQTNIPRTEGKTFEDMTFEFLYEGTDPTAGAPDTLVGKVVEITITASYSDGKSASPTSKVVTFDFVVKGVSFGAIAVDGERKNTMTITGVRHYKANTTSGGSSQG